MLRGESTAADNLSTAIALRIRGTPKLDGILSEDVWSEAHPTSEFLQREPHEGQPASERTEVRIIYNDKAVYFGIMCYDSDPDKIIARERRRDQDLTKDDSLSIILDTFHDRRSAFLFSTNSLGTKFDALITDEGRVINEAWDEKWSAATKVSESGWVAEIEIPFKTLRTSQGRETGLGI